MPKAYADLDEASRRRFDCAALNDDHIEEYIDCIRKHCHDHMDSIAEQTLYGRTTAEHLDPRSVKEVVPSLLTAGLHDHNQIHRVRTTRVFQEASNLFVDVLVASTRSKV